MKQLVPHANVLSLLRLLHLAGSLVIGTYVYSPWRSDQLFEAIVAYLVFPAMALSGLWMWQQGRLTRLVARCAGRGTG